jgi:hypothetical protein
MKVRLPHIVLARLKAQDAAAKGSGAPAAVGAVAARKHPDANLLAALAEDTLTGTERSQVLDHLSQCADCREVAALLLPVEELVAVPARREAASFLRPAEVLVAAPAPGAPARGAAARRRSPWPLLRWAAMTVALGGVATVVVLHPGLWRRHQELIVQAPLPAPAVNIATARPAAPAPPLPQALPEAGAKPGMQGEERESASALQASRTTGTSPVQNQPLARGQVSARATLMASSRPPAAHSTATVPGMSPETEEAKQKKSLEAAPAAAPAAPTGAESADADRMMREPQSYSREQRAPGASVHALAGNAGATSSPHAAAKAAPQMTVQPVFRMAASLPAAEARAKTIEMKGGPAAALWSVTSEGKVQRSVDAGRSFTTIEIAPQTVFRAVATLGNDVWAGGTSGRLYHSTDAGATWEPVSIQQNGAVLKETIIAVQLNDAQHLTVTTESGAHWASDDGGHHWQAP